LDRACTGAGKDGTDDQADVEVCWSDDITTHSGCSDEAVRKSGHISLRTLTYAETYYYHRRGLARERTSPKPLRRTDNDLDFYAKDHDDKQQEKKITYHVFNSGD
jgi:hypothetical protein